MQQHIDLSSEKIYNIEVIYDKEGGDFQELVERAFKIYLKTGSYSLHKGEDEDE